MDPKEPIVTAYTNQEYTACLDLLESAPKEVTSLTDMRILHASCLININGRTGEAHDILDHILAEEPQNGLAFYGKGLAFLKENNLEASFENFNKAAELDKTGVISKAQIMKLKTEKLLKSQRKSNRISNRKSKEAAAKSAIECEICHKTFAQIFSLNRHKLIHSGERPHKCELCSFGFVQKSDLQRHMSVHNDTANFNCESCEKKFKSKKNLSLHMQTHGTEKPFKCEVCGKDFKYRRLMKLHSIVHSKRNKYNCDFCEKVFVTKPSLKAHVMSHINRKLKEESEKQGASKSEAKVQASVKPTRKSTRNEEKQVKTIEKEEEAQISPQTAQRLVNLQQELSRIKESFPNLALNSDALTIFPNLPNKLRNSTQNLRNFPPELRNLTSSPNPPQNLPNSPQNSPNPPKSLPILTEISVKPRQPSPDSTQFPQNLPKLQPIAQQANLTVTSSNLSAITLNSTIPDELPKSRLSFELPSSLKIRKVRASDLRKTISENSMADSRISSVLSNPQLSVAINGLGQAPSKWMAASSPQITQVNRRTGFAIVQQQIKLEPVDVASETSGNDAQNSSNQESLFGSENENSAEWNLFFKSIMHDLSKMDDRQKRKFKQQTFMLIDDILE